MKVLVRKHFTNLLKQFSQEVPGGVEDRIDGTKSTEKEGEEEEEEEEDLLEKTSLLTHPLGFPSEP